MKKILLTAIVSLSCLSLATAETREIDNASFLYQDGKWYREFQGELYEVIPGVITVKFARHVGAAAIKEFNSSIEVKVRRVNKLGIYDLQIPYYSNPLDYVLIYKMSGLVEFVEVCTYGEYLGTPNDSYFDNQWNLHNTGQTGGTSDADIDAPEGWDIEVGADNVVLSIIDSGTDIDHEDLISNMWKNEDEIPGNGIDDDDNGYIDDYDGWDFYNNDNDPNGPYDHGTHVAGITGAMTNNALGVAGVAGGWYPGQRGCLLMPLGVGDYSPDGSVLDDAIIYAADNGARVLTMSLTVGPSTAIDQAVDYAVNTKGCIVDCASGNSNGPVSYPALLSDIIAVGSTTHKDLRASYSNYGSELDVVAPGGDGEAGIYSTSIGDTYVYHYGTSMAAPHVAGLAGLLFSQNPGRTNTEVRNLIESTADDLGTPGWDQYYGWGRINAESALSAVPDTIPPAPVTDLAAATGSSGGEVDLTWTAPGDDGNVGTAATYDVRYIPYANGPIDTEEEWQAATQAIGEPSPSPAGTPESWTVTGLTPGEAYYFVLKTADEVPNWSDLSNSPWATAGEGGERNYVNQDIDVKGTRSGSYLDTHASDNVYESITEVESRGNPARRTSLLEHKWTIDVTGGETVTFNVEAYHSPNAEGDYFIFAYSINDETYIDMLNVTKTYDDNTLQTVSLPNTISGTVYIRVVDANRTPTNTQLDAVYIDWMFIECFGTPPPKKMHVSNIDMTTETKTAGPNTRTNAIATVTIVDSANTPVSGATVYGQWSGLTSDSDEATTDASGTVSIESDQVKNACGWYTFCVTEVAKTGWTYDSLANVENCDSIYYCGGSLSGFSSETEFQVSNCLSPLSPEVKIGYCLPVVSGQSSQHVTVKIYNISGQVVKTLVDKEQIAGSYKACWNGKDEGGGEASNGIYFCRLTIDDSKFVDTKKIIILR